MKIALQLGLIPGQTVSDKAKWAKDNGVEGIEVGAIGGAHEELYRQAEEINGLVPICSVCGNSRTDGSASFDFLNPDKTKRRASIEGSKSVLEFCGQVGAVGQIVPPIFGGPVVPDLSPWKSVAELEDELMFAAAQELGEWAASKSTKFMLEPLNRYEQHYLRKQSDGIRIIEAVKSPGLGLLSDFFHMHIEENQFARSLSRRQWLHHPYSPRRQYPHGAGDGRHRFCGLLQSPQGKRLRWFHGLRVRHHRSGRKRKRSQSAQIAGLYARMYRQSLKPIQLHC